MKKIILISALLIYNSNIDFNYIFCQELWTATDTVTAPSPRWITTSVWTGNKMIIWGGRSNEFPYSLNTGGIYDLISNSWQATSVINAPPGSYWHTAVWTGSKMIVWGGMGYINVLNTGGIFDPVTNSWSLTSTINSPASRQNHTAIWTGTKMIVWGGLSTVCENTGGIYDPISNTWSPTSTVNAPSARYTHTAVWTGIKMIVWGGFDCDTTLNTGGIYDPITNSWDSTSLINAPSVRSLHTAIWTSTNMIVWGGINDLGGSLELNTGGIYNPITNIWIATDTVNAPSRRHFQTTVWTGIRMIVWGGWSNGLVNTGGIYNPGINTWISTTIINVPSPRAYHTSVWCDTKMIVWGGSSGYSLKSGGVYTNPAVIQISKIGNNVPRIFSLYQNYPNPFNSYTKIKFDIPLKVKIKESKVEVIIFDIVGKEIAILLNEVLSPGAYDVEWNAVNFPSGIYFYKLKSGDLTDTKKMVLVK